VPVVPTTTASTSHNTPTAPKGGQVVNRAAPKKSFLQKLFG
jgi:hypothetical protein